MLNSLRTELCRLAFWYSYFLCDSSVRKYHFYKVSYRLNQRPTSDSGFLNLATRSDP